MTLDEAIKYYEKASEHMEDFFGSANSTVECQQLAEWLKELKKHKEKIGQWIMGKTEYGALGIGYTEKKCSCCGWSHSLIIPTNYCPNCGAEMENEDG